MQGQIHFVISRDGKHDPNWLTGATLSMSNILLPHICSKLDQNTSVSEAGDSSAHLMFQAGAYFTN